MNEKLKDSRIDTAQASGNDLPPIQTDETPIPPQEKAMKGIKEPSASPCDPNAVAGKPVVSIQKLEANRKNGEKSTGPRTDAGKEKAAANSYKHGLFANRLFPPGEQGVKDKAGYLAVANSLHMRYRLEGFMEEFWVEKIAIEALRLARVLGYEQKTTMLSWRYPFDLLSGD